MSLALHSELSTGMSLQDLRPDVTVMPDVETAPHVPPPRPRLRGRIHQAAFVASVAGVAWLVTSSNSPRALVAAWIYGLSMVALYFTSSTYHVVTWPPRAHQLMRRADHSMIYVLIAGTYTPLCLLALHGTTSWLLLALVWSGAAFGMTLVLTDHWPKVATSMYLVLGWVALLALPEMLGRPGLLVTIAAAGLLYTLGAILFGMRKPRLNPHWFGFHEFWHVPTAAAGLLFFAVNLALIQAA